MGDPAVRVWTGFPAALSASYPSTLPVGANSVVVTVTEGGAPERGRPRLPAQGNRDVLQRPHRCGGADRAAGQRRHRRHHEADGDQAQPPAGAGRHRRRRPRTSSSATSPPPWMTTTAAAARGTATRIVNPGETIQLKVQVKNFGSQSAADVTATLTTGGPLRDHHRRRRAVRHHRREAPAPGAPGTSTSRSATPLRTATSSASAST